MWQPVIKDLKEKAKEPMDTKLQYSALIPLTDKSIIVDHQKCNGCGVCAKVCSVHNIKIIDKQPEWQHQCEMCFACDEWCPMSAIQHWGRAEGVKYHHPEVKLSDMF
jgi:MinD superfamily P-loop ATPase